jgi:hypothetical protein
LPCPLFSEAIIAKITLGPSLDKRREKGVFRLMGAHRELERPCAPEKDSASRLARYTVDGVSFRAIRSSSGRLPDY